MNQAIIQLCEHAIRDNVFPAAEVLVRHEDQIVFHSYFGDARNGTLFDIASLSKAVCTASVAMELCSSGLLRLSDTVGQWLGKADLSIHSQMTVQQLLSHVSGLAAWQPFYRELPRSLVGTDEGRAWVLDACYQEPAIALAGDQIIYSDIGYILLGRILEEAGNAPLDVLFSHHIAQPLGLHHTFFIRNIGQISKQQADILAQNRRFAPTEDCPWRKRIIHAQVHDPNAYALGGVAGHAGLFSCALDLDAFAAALACSYHKNCSWLPQQTVYDFLHTDENKPENDQYVLGWMRPSSVNSSSGRFFSANSIGHLGYTGCSLWIDLDNKYHVILLSNRIHPTSTNTAIRAFRPQLHDLIYQELIRS